MADAPKPPAAKETIRAVCDQRKVGMQGIGPAFRDLEST